MGPVWKKFLTITFTIKVDTLYKKVLYFVECGKNKKESYAIAI
ncbi:hypothetical protein RVIR1_03630 [Candidatus Rickettsiella viridis]|uniref:Uncharacterized protein n=1 Tax=Candidatus Rickettsiella viridis TaxID=676208 RepID=A0A2Z5UV41_9COXI|nr:hypothetical protein RVIR1_03630 [Candidatus Rickettsiella viridis]